jgi:hypothetical protein
MQQIDVEYFGHRFVVVLLQCRELTRQLTKLLNYSAHAGAAPW